MPWIDSGGGGGETWRPYGGWAEAYQQPPRQPAAVPGFRPGETPPGYQLINGQYQFVGSGGGQQAAQQARMQQPWNLINNLGTGMLGPTDWGFGALGQRPPMGGGPPGGMPPGGGGGGGPARPLNVNTGITAPQLQMPGYTQGGQIAGMSPDAGSAYGSQGQALAGPNQLALGASYYPAANDLRQRYQQAQSVAGLGWGDIGSQQQQFLQNLGTQQQGNLLSLLQALV